MLIPRLKGPENGASGAPTAGRALRSGSPVLGAFHFANSGLPMCRRLAFASFLVAAAGIASGAPDAGVLYSRSGSMLFDGKFGPLAQFQSALGKAANLCSGLPPIEVDGRFGNATVTALKKWATCQSSSALAASDPARQGKISDTAWRLLLPDVPPPDLDARVQTLVLTYEATDYTDAEWNFCQNLPKYEPGVPGSICHTNDPRSYLTWGPRGATAGHGRELQVILWLVSKQDQTVLKGAFGTEAAQVDRLTRLEPSAVEKVLCSVWMSPERRAQWKAALADLGRGHLVRAAYDAYYRSAHSDGAKILTFSRLYQQAHLTITEVDYGFFVDRATHSTPPGESEIGSLAQQLAAEVAGRDLPNARARLYLSRTLLAGNASAQADRQGRDMAFLVDAFPTGDLTTNERAQWSARGRLKASDVGLSDERAAPAFVPSTVNLEGVPPATLQDLTPAEATGCPDAVLHPSK